MFLLEVGPIMLKLKEQKLHKPPQFLKESEKPILSCFSQVCRQDFLKGNIHISHITETGREVKGFWHVMSRGEEKRFFSFTCRWAQEGKGHAFNFQFSSELTEGPDPCSFPTLSSAGETVNAWRRGGWEGKQPRALVEASNLNPASGLALVNPTAANRISAGTR